MPPEPSNPSPPPAARISRSAIAAWLVLAAAIVAAYANTFRVPLLLDDTGSIAENASIRRLWPLGPALAPPALAGVGGRPIANLSFALNHALGGLDVRGYHAVNLAIHLAAALALCGLVRRTLELPGVAERTGLARSSVLAVALGAALLWSLHPLQTEAVTYLSQRTESLMALFYLATLYCFVRGLLTSRPRWLAAAVGLCALGQATKEVMVTAPILVLLYDRTFGAGSFRGAWRARRGFYAALAATWLILLFLLRDVHERGVGHASVAWWEYGLTASRAIVLYLRLALWPAPLVFDYGTDVVHRVSEVWPSLLLVAALAAGTVWALRRRPLLGFAGAWLLLILAPATSVVPVAGQTMAEHRMYLPLAALAVGAAWAAHRWLGPRAVFATAAIGLILGGATFARNRDYRDAVALWTDTAAKRPLNARAHASLGSALLGAGQLAPAIAALEHALRLEPRLPEAHNNLANALLDANRPAEAIGHFAAALELRPGTASTHYNFGNALLAAGRTAEAIAQQQQALILRPEFPEASCALGNALLGAGRREDSIPHFRAALRLRPDLTPAHFGLANALVQTGRFRDAAFHYEATLRAVPNSVEARYNLATALAQDGRLTEAIAQFEAVLRLQPDLEPARRNLEALRRAAP